jgi:hypothetical protein
VTGFFSGSATFGSSTLISKGGTDFFVAKYDSLGNFLWAFRDGSAGDDVGNVIAVDSSDAPIVTGYFSGSMTWAGTNLPSAGDKDVFILKLDPAGSPIWIKRAGTGGPDEATAIATDTMGNF